MRSRGGHVMSLFLVKHQHPAEACPAGHPQMGPKLLVHLSQPSAESFGVQTHAEAVVDGEHTFYLMLSADQAAQGERSLAPCAPPGRAEVTPASLGARVAARAV